MIKESFSDAWKTYKKHFIIIAVISIIAYLPAQILIELIDNFVVINGDLLEKFQLKTNIFNTIRHFFSGIVLLSISRIIISNDDITLASIFKFSIKKWGVFTVLSLYSSLIIALFSLLLIIPGLIKAVRFSIAPYLIVYANTNVSDSLDLSEELVKGHWWKVVFVSIIAFFGELLIELIYILTVARFGNIAIFIGAIIIKVFTAFFTVFLAHYFKSFYDRHLNEKDIAIENVLP